MTSSLEHPSESKSSISHTIKFLTIFSSSTNNENIVTEVDQTFPFPAGSVKPGQNNVITVIQVRIVSLNLPIPINPSLEDNMGLNEAEDCKLPSRRVDREHLHLTFSQMCRKPSRAQGASEDICSAAGTSQRGKCKEKLGDTKGKADSPFIDDGTRIDTHLCIGIPIKSAACSTKVDYLGNERVGIFLVSPSVMRLAGWLAIYPEEFQTQRLVLASS